MALWKSVENFPALGMDRAADRKQLEPGVYGDSGGLAKSLRACSACDGDYEDPDRTARMPDEEEADLAPEIAREKGQERAEDVTALDDGDRER
jgi:hypothetical protein